MIVAQLMTRDPPLLLPDDSVASASALMRAHDIGMIPVVYDRDSRALCGVITEADIAHRCVELKHPPGCHVADHMTPPPIASVREDDDVSVVLPIMEQHLIRRVPVLDAEGGVVGIVTQASLALRVPDEPAQSLETLLERISEVTPQ